MLVYLHRLNSFLQGEQTGKTRETKDAKLFGLQPKEKRNTNTHIKFLASANHTHTCGCIPKRYQKCGKRVVWDPRSFKPGSGGKALPIEGISAAS